MMQSLKQLFLSTPRRWASALSLICLLAFQPFVPTIFAHSVEINPEYQVVWGVAFSSDERYVVATTQEGVVVVFDTASCGVRSVIVPAPVNDYLWGHTLTGIAWSPGKSEFATAMRDGTVRLWNIQPYPTGYSRITEKAAYTTNSSVKDGPLGLRSVAFSPDGSLIAAAGHGPEIYVWSTVGASAPLHVLNGEAETINTVAFGANNTILISAGLDGVIRYWDLRRGTEARTIKTPGPIVNAAVSADRRYVATTSGFYFNESHGVVVYDFETGEEVRRLSVRPWSLTFSPDSRFLATGMQDESRIRLFELERGQEKWSTVISQGGEVKSLVFSQDGRRILAGVSVDAPYLLDAETGAILKRYGWSGCSLSE